MSIGPLAAPPALWTTRPPTSSDPVSSKIVLGVISPSSRAAVAVIGFKGEPVGEAPWAAGGGFEARAGRVAALVGAIDERIAGPVTERVVLGLGVRPGVEGGVVRR